MITKKPTPPVEEPKAAEEIPVAQYPRAVYRNLTEKEEKHALRKIAHEFKLDLLNATDLELAKERLVPYESKNVASKEEHDQALSDGWADHPDKLATAKDAEAADDAEASEDK